MQEKQEQDPGDQQGRAGAQICQERLFICQESAINGKLVLQGKVVGTRTSNRACLHYVLVPPNKSVEKAIFSKSIPLAGSKI